MDIVVWGLDVNNFSYVVNFDLFDNVEIYIYCIGCIGWVGKIGKAIVLVEFIDCCLL